MADFKTALEALGTGRLKIEALSNQIDSLLNDNPKYAKRMLTQLDEVLEAGGIEDKHYADLKRQINDFRRTHAVETEAEPAEGEETEFDQDGAAVDAMQSAAEAVAADEDATIQRDAPDSEDATVQRTVDADEDATVQRATDDTEDATVQKASPDATQVLDESEKPADATAGGTGVDFDLLTGDVSESGPSSIPPGTGPTGTDWQQPQQAAGYEPGKDLGPGDVIKYRFKLLDVLGVGGMGKVYKGIDLLKEEARDKNPYVAIKLLNEDFKSHPEAFISLQRESSRQQKLAHPNIATVYDFDRIGGKGTPVFITMELMEGLPLNTYIKKIVRKQGGLPFEEAFPVVKQLSAALSYAHERRLVHSDFKPGNAFKCNDGTIKTLDFGIARAVKNPVTGEAEKTLFDPGKLGALTPAYASLEMLEGEEPDTRDDTYALGCVAYELLTGKHPFNKLPATTAMENGLVPAPVKSLNKKSNRALRKALAFKREDRSQTVDEFIEEFEGLPTWHKNPLTIAAAILVLVGLIMLNPALSYLHEQKITGIIEGINSGDRQVMMDTLKELPEMEKADQTRIIDESRNPIQKYFAKEVARVIDVSGESYSFPKAGKVLERIGALYPETAFYLEQEANIASARKTIEAELYQQYIAALDPAAAVQDPSVINATSDILDILRTRVDPRHPLLGDPRPANAYRLAAEQAFSDQDLDQALVLVNNGLQTAPDDPRLTDLQSKIQTAITVADLNDRLSGIDFAGLEDFKASEEDILQLARLSTPEDSPVLSSMSVAMKTAINGELDGVLKDGSRSDAETLAADYGNLLSSLLLGQELTRIKLAHLSGDERTAAIAQIVNTDKAAIDGKLAAPNLDDATWEAELLANVRELDSLKEEDPAIAEELGGLREQIATLYVDRANEVLNQNRFDAAGGYVDRGARFAPQLAMIQETRTAVTESKNEFERQLRVKDLKEQFTIQTDADRLAEANETFNKLKAELPEDDPYLTKIAPNALADSYARLARSRGESGDTENAYKLVQAGLELSPRNLDLLALREEYVVEINIAELRDKFQNARVFTQDEIIAMSRQVNEISRGDPQRYSEFREESENLLSQRINFLKESDENSAAALAEAASRMFPASAVLANLARENVLEPWPGVAEAEAAIAAGELSKGQSLLDEALNSDFSNHPQVLGFQKALEENQRAASATYERYLEAKEKAGDKYANLRQTKKLLSRAQAQWLDNPDYDAAELDIDNLIANAPDNPTRKVIAREGPLQLGDGGTIVEDWKPVSSGRECASNLAGYGSRARAICFDLVNTGWRGPLMVVVPPGEGVDSEFAIGKYEVSVADYSKYCALSGNCKPITSKTRLNDPMTGISLSDAQQYVEWLSERTGKTYRLPTREEWEYAANAAGKQPKKDVNCRVVLGDKVLKGTGIVSVKSGKANGWGLKNYVGNVQEWIMDASGTLAAGGSWSDAHAKCDITLQRPHPGDGDETTGFRVVLEDVGSA